MLLILTLLLGITTLFANQSSGQTSARAAIRPYPFEPIPLEPIPLEPIDYVETVANIQAYPPELIGVGQEILFVASVSPPAPPSDPSDITNEGNFFHGFQINITRPDGYIETIEIIGDPAGSSVTFYTPNQVGNYSVEFFYPGETFDVSNPVRYLSCSNYTSIYVQEEPVVIKHPSVDVTISPDPVGANQMVELGITFSPLPPSDTDVFHDFQVYIRYTGREPYTGEDFPFVVQNLGPFDSSTDGEYFLRCTAPTLADNYFVQVYYWGEWFSVGDNYYGEYYFPIFGEPWSPFVVQNDPVFLPLNISSSGSGSTDPASGVVDCEPGDVPVTASPASGWRFSHWILDGADVGTNPHYLISMFSSHELIAIFETDGTGKNNPPNAKIVSITPISGQESAVEGEKVNFSGSGYDSDGFIVEYRWRSSIDGLLSNSKDFSTSSLSVGTHTIYFWVQDNNGTRSMMEAQTFKVVGAVSVGVVLTVTGVGFAGSMGVGALIHFNSKWHSTVRIKNKLQKKLKKETEKEKKEEEEEKREKDKGKPYLKLKADFPSRIMEATAYEPNLKITNIGPSQAEGVVISSVCTPGLVLCKTSAEIKELQPGESRSLTFPMAANEQLRKGVYSNKFEVESKNALSRAKTCHTRAVKIGVLSGTGLLDSSKQIKDWLRRESYVFSELDDADSLVGGLLNYDLLVLTPDIELPKKWIRNISSFVRNGQSLCAFDRIITEEKKLLTNLLGYSEMRYELIECDKAVIIICDNEFFVPREFALGEEFQVGKSWGNFCMAGLNTGKALAWYENLADGSKMDSSGTIPAVTTNEYGKGKVVHFNFHAEASADRIGKILKKTFNWLLS